MDERVARSRLLSRLVPARARAPRGVRHQARAPARPRPRNRSASRTRSSASRSVTARVEPASAAARLAAPAAKKRAHSASSGATSASSTQAFFWRRRPGGRRWARAASSAAAPQGGHVGAGVAGRHVGGGDRLAQRLGGAGEVGVGGGRQGVGVGGSVIASPQSTQPTSCQRPSAQSKDRSKTPPPASRTGRPGRPRPATARARPAGRPPAGALVDREPGRRSRSPPAPRGLPPRARLHPVREHRAHLPQPAAPQELLGTLPGTPLRTSTGSSYRLMRASFTARRPLGPTPGTGGRGRHPPVRTDVRTPTTVHAPTDSGSRADADRRGGRTRSRGVVGGAWPALGGVRVARGRTRAEATSSTIESTTQHHEQVGRWVTARPRRPARRRRDGASDSRAQLVPVAKERRAAPPAAGTRRRRPRPGDERRRDASSRAISMPPSARIPGGGVALGPSRITSSRITQSAARSPLTPTMATSQRALTTDAGHLSTPSGSSSCRRPGRQARRVDERASGDHQFSRRRTRRGGTR